MTDPYATLGVSKTATDKDIRSAYRRLAKQYHPDHNAGDAKAEERFKAVNTAYAILGDKEKRARFDRGEIDASGQERGPFGGGFGGGQGGFGGGPRSGAYTEMNQEDLGEFFSDIFGAGGFGTAGRGGFGSASAGSGQGRDVESELRITFLDSVLGVTRELAFTDGRKTTMRIPPGVEDGKMLRVRGKGQPGRPGRDGRPGMAGDLLLRIHVTPDPSYTREGRNLRIVQDIDLKTAILGGKVSVRTPKGTVALTIKPHSDSGTVLRIPGRGVAEHGSTPAGDLLVVLRIKLGDNIPSGLEDFLRHPDSVAPSAAGTKEAASKPAEEVAPKPKRKPRSTKKTG